jgi:hypothetical protein
MGASCFWIVGGEYQNTGFADLIPGTGRVVGPFGEESEAEQAWRKLSEEHRSQCLVRFTIAIERGKPDLQATRHARN